MSSVRTSGRSIKVSDTPHVVVVVVPSLIFAFDYDLLVAAATLAAAAIFAPVHRRVHAMVERRSNRARYDAARVVDEFAALPSGGACPRCFSNASSATAHEPRPTVVDRSRRLRNRSSRWWRPRKRIRNAEPDGRRFGLFTARSTP